MNNFQGLMMRNQEKLEGFGKKEGGQSGSGVNTSYTMGSKKYM